MRNSMVGKPSTGLETRLKEILNHAETTIVIEGELALSGTLPSWARNTDYYKEVTQEEIKEFKMRGYKVKLGCGLATMGTANRFGQGDNENGYISASYTRVFLKATRKTKKR